MKNILLLLTFLSTSLFAQDSGWFETGANWTYQYTINGVIEDEIHQAEFTVTEQTILNGQACSKMEVFSTDNHNSLGCIATPPPYYFYESNDSIFYASDYDNTFRLAYDFGAEAGDSWEFIYPVAEFADFTNYIVTVDSTSTIQQDGQELKVMYLDYTLISGEEYSSIGYWKFTIIEKIGATQNMFFVPFGYWSVCEGPFYVKTRCYNDSEISYIGAGFSSCFLGVNEAEPEINIGMYPNPTQDNFTIEALDNLILEISVYTVSGIRIYSAQINDHMCDVNTSAFKSGLYLISVQTENGWVYKRLVIN